MPIYFERHADALREFDKTFPLASALNTWSVLGVGSCVCEYYDTLFHELNLLLRARGLELVRPEEQSALIGIWYDGTWERRSTDDQLQFGAQWYVQYTGDTHVSYADVFNGVANDIRGTLNRHGFYFFNQGVGCQDFPEHIHFLPVSIDEDGAVLKIAFLVNHCTEPGEINALIGYLFGEQHPTTTMKG